MSPVTLGASLRSGGEEFVGRVDAGHGADEDGDPRAVDVDDGAVEEPSVAFPVAHGCLDFGAALEGVVSRQGTRPIP